LAEALGQAEAWEFAEFPRAMTPRRQEELPEESDKAALRVVEDEAVALAAEV